MIPEQVTPDQREVLAEIGHLHLMLESHKMAVKHCREQLERLSQQLMEMEQASQSS